MDDNQKHRVHLFESLNCLWSCSGAIWSLSIEMRGIRTPGLIAVTSPRQHVHGAWHHHCTELVTLPRIPLLRSPPLFKHLGYYCSSGHYTKLHVFIVTTANIPFLFVLLEYPTLGHDNSNILLTLIRTQRY